jgi:hypothetical protein
MQPYDPCEACIAMQAAALAYQAAAQAEQWVQSNTIARERTVEGGSANETGGGSSLAQVGEQALQWVVKGGISCVLSRICTSIASVVVPPLAFGTAGLFIPCDSAGCGATTFYAETGEEMTVRPDATPLSGGRSGQNVKNLKAEPNSFVPGSPGRIYATNENGEVVRDITKERVKNVIPGQGFEHDKNGVIEREPTAQERQALGKIWGAEHAR